MQAAGGWFPLTFQLLDCDVVVGVDANFAGDSHGLFGDFPGGEVSVFHEGPGSGCGVASAGTDGGQRLVGVDYIAGAGDEEGLSDVGYQQEGLKVAEHLVGAPVLGKLDGGAVEVAGVLLELGLEARKEGEGICGRACESGENLVLIEAADFFRRVLEHVVAQGDLAVRGHDHLTVAANANDGGGANPGMFCCGDIVVRKQGKPSANRCPVGRNCPPVATLSIGHLHGLPPVLNRTAKRTGAADGSGEPGFAASDCLVRKIEQEVLLLSCAPLRMTERWGTGLSGSSDSRRRKGFQI